NSRVPSVNSTVMILLAKYGRDELCFASRIRLAVASVLLRQPAFQIPIPLRQLPVQPKRVPELNLLCPPRVPGLHQVQVRRPSLPGRVWLDKETPPRPVIQLGRHITPAIRNEPPQCLLSHHVQVNDRGHQVDDRLGGKPGNSSRPDMLDSASQP